MRLGQSWVWFCFDTLHPGDPPFRTECRLGRAPDNLADPSRVRRAHRMSIESLAVLAFVAFDRHEQTFERQVKLSRLHPIV